MFIDEITLHLKAGHGGNGVVRWRHEKGKEYGGPSGGNGGKGGNIYAVGVKDLGILAAYRNLKEISAEDGQDGFKDEKQGAQGEGVAIKVPVGSKLTNLETNYSLDVLDDNNRIILLSGGRGGLGNAHFKSSTNTRPKEWTPGEPGEEANYKIELYLLVDIGLIGLPNSGKSSLLNTLTGARSKVGAFPFTTIEPNLGEYYGLIIADIPGLIEGASLGRGLGHKFLKHIERTKTLIHCISAESQDPFKDYEIVRNELQLYNESITAKPEIIALTKADMLSKDELTIKKLMLKEAGKVILPVSIIDDQLIKEFGNYIVKIKS